MLFRLGPDIKHYDWGSSGHLSAFLGLSSSGLPDAEAWFGNHPLSATTVDDGGNICFFKDWLRSRNSSFDLLVKLISASQNLSIQVHPNEIDAKQGFERENFYAIGQDSPDRVFKDPRAKPELIVALSPDFRAMVGFVNEAVLAARLDALVSYGALPNSTRDWPIFRHHPRAFVERVLTDSREVEYVSRGLSKWISAESNWSQLEALGVDSQTLKKVNQEHPGDSGLLLAVAMHHVRLDAGNGLFVAPGLAHAYVEGFGLELMLPSDNVLRAGLTSKARHPEDFLQAATLVGTEAPEIITPKTTAGISRYPGPSMPFELRKIEGSAGDFTLRRDAIIVVEAGHLLAGQASDLREVARGEVVYVEALDLVRADETTTRAWIASSQ